MDTPQDKLAEIIATWERGQREGWDIETRLEIFGHALKELQRMRDHLHEQIQAHRVKYVYAEPIGSLLC